MFFDLKLTNCLQFCFHSRAAQKTQHLLVLPTLENTKHLDKYVKLLQTGSVASVPSASSTICELTKDTYLAQVQATDGLLHRVGSHGSMPLRIGNQQRVVAKVVDVPRDTLAFQRNQIHDGWFEQ